MKRGALPLEADLERVRSVRGAVGDEVALWVDAVNQLTRASAPAWCAALARVGVAAIQAPLPFDDVSGMADINVSLLPVIATEAEHREDAFRALVEAKAVTYLQYCVGLCGGFSGATRIDALAAKHAVNSTPQCFSTAVLQAASLHLGAARAMNIATRTAKGDLLFFLSPNVEVAPDTVTALVSRLQPDVDRRRDLMGRGGHGPEQRLDDVGGAKRHVRQGVEPEREHHVGRGALVRGVLHHPAPPQTPAGLEELSGDETLVITERAERVRERKEPVKRIAGVAASKGEVASCSGREVPPVQKCVVILRELSLPSAGC